MVGITQSGFVSGSGYISQGKVKSTYTSVNDVSGIGAGTGCYNITVGGNTDLNGAVITSTADAVKNVLDTGGVDTARWLSEAEYAVFRLYEESLMSLSIYNRIRYLGRENLAERINPGDIGYIIEDYGDGNYEVEFSEPDGTTKALAVIKGCNLELVTT